MSQGEHRTIEATTPATITPGEAVGMLLLPIVFVWPLLSDRHPTVMRVLAVAWTIVCVTFVSFGGGATAAYIAAHSGPDLSVPQGVHAESEGPAQATSNTLAATTNAALLVTNATQAAPTNEATSAPTNAASSLAPTPAPTLSAYPLALRARFEDGLKSCNSAWDAVLPALKRSDAYRAYGLATLGKTTCWQAADTARSVATELRQHPDVPVAIPDVIDACAQALTDRAVGLNTAASTVNGRMKPSDVYDAVTVIRETSEEMTSCLGYYKVASKAVDVLNKRKGLGPS